MAAKATKAPATRSRSPDHARFASNRFRIPRYNNVGEASRSTAVTAATGMKSAGLDTACVTNNTAPAPTASSAPITTAKTARLAKYSRTCRRSWMKRRTTDPATRSPANAYTNGASAAADIQGRDEARTESLCGPPGQVGGTDGAHTPA